MERYGNLPEQRRSMRPAKPGRSPTPNLAQRHGNVVNLTCSRHPRRRCRLDRRCGAFPAMGSTVGWMREMPETQYTSTPEGTCLAHQVTGDGTFNLVILTTVHSAA
jgi:hypothetical protein